MTDPSILEINLEEILDFLKQEIQLQKIYHNILIQKIINREAERKELIITSEEIQFEAEQQRRDKHLEKAEDTFAWLNDQMITSDDWEAGIRKKILKKKLADCLFSTEVKKFFVENKADFDQVLLYQIIIPYEQVAWELFYQIEEEEINFYQAAHLYDIDEKRRDYCGFEGRLFRWAIKPDLAATIFKVKPGELIPPIQTEQGYHLLLVEKFIPAELTTETYQKILNDLFDRWLANELNYMLSKSEEVNYSHQH